MQYRDQFSILLYLIIKMLVHMKNFLFLTSVFVLFSLNSIGQNQKQQANYILNIVKYVAWPELYKTGDFVIGVLGTSTITEELRKLATTKKVFSQKITVVEFKSTEEITKCHVLFITDLNSGLIKLALTKILGNATLVIGETEGLATQGAGINFIKVDGELKFQINEVSIRKRGLQVDSKLVNLSL